MVTQKEKVRAIKDDIDTSFSNLDESKDYFSKFRTKYYYWDGFINAISVCWSLTNKRKTEVQEYLEQKACKKKKKLFSKKEITVYKGRY